MKYSNETDYQKLKNKMRNEYRKTIHDMIVINRFMKTDDKTIKKLEGLFRFMNSGSTAKIAIFSLFSL